jgi:hypothetical protein
MKTTDVDGVIKDATLLFNGCVFGIVVKDNKGRFDKGNWIRTSYVKEIVGDIVYTRNSSYKIIGTLKKEKNPSLYDAI